MSCCGLTVTHTIIQNLVKLNINNYFYQTRLLFTTLQYNDNSDRSGSVSSGRSSGGVSGGSASGSSGSVSVGSGSSSGGVSGGSASGSSGS